MNRHHQRHGDNTISPGHVSGSLLLTVNGMQYVHTIESSNRMEGFQDAYKKASTTLSDPFHFNPICKSLHYIAQVKLKLCPLLRPASQHHDNGVPVQACPHHRRNRRHRRRDGRPLHRPRHQSNRRRPTRLPTRILCLQKRPRESL